MKTFEIKTDAAASRIVVGGRLAGLADELAGRRTVIVTDPNVFGLYRDAFPQTDVIQIGTGERIKTLDTVRTIYDQLVTLEADRSTFVVGIGGGIVCDVAGFVASTYLRGVRFGFVATTLLGQVDASVGGKNGVNFGGYKNIIGTFNQPEFVICDLEMLKTLPEKEIRCGYAEIVKHGCIDDGDLFGYLEENAERAVAGDPEVLERVVYDSVALKAAVVARDEKEQGERRILNLGHTIGHAIEKNTGNSHGEAVSAGLVFAARLSTARGLLPASQRDRIIDLLQRFGLPVETDTPAEGVIDAFHQDKKREGGDVFFVLLERIGMPRVEKISLTELADVIRAY